MSQQNDAGSGAGSEDAIGTVFVVPPDGRRFAAELLTLNPTSITLRVAGRLMLIGEQFVAEPGDRRALFVVARCELTKDFRWRVEGTFQRDVAADENPAPFEPSPDLTASESATPPAKP